METIDPVRLTRIQRSTTMRTLRKFNNIHMDFDDIFSESMVATILSISKYDEDRGSSLYSYIYSNTMNHLRNYVNRKVIPQTVVDSEKARIFKDALHNRVIHPSISPAIEARDLLARMKCQLDPLSLEILKYIEGGLSHRGIAGVLGVERKVVDRRVVKMRNILKTEGQ